MTRDEAIKILKPLARRLIRNVYDDLTNEQTVAVFTLVRTFEYPDWEERRVARLWINTKE